VTVPGVEGRAGMAALTLSCSIQDFDMKGLHAYISKSLPKYAVPVWIRILDPSSAHHTGTFKQVKHEYRNEGMNPSLVKDAMYWAQPGTTEFAAFGEKEFEFIQSSSRIF
jgi:hypothetical protein